MIKIIEKLKKYTIHDFYFQENSDGNIVKHVKDNTMYDWECEIYKYLLKNQKSPICVPITPSQKCFIYQTNKLKPLCEILKNKNKRNLLLNELFAFVFNLKNSNFIHGNLHLYNIFYDSVFNQFYVINLTDSFLLSNKDINFIPNFQQQTYSKFVEQNDITYWDLLSIYSSLKIFFKNDILITKYLTDRIRVYIPNDIVTEYDKEEEFVKFSQKLSFRNSFQFW